MIPGFKISRIRQTIIFAAKTSIGNRGCWRRKRGVQALCRYGRHRVQVLEDRIRGFDVPAINESDQPILHVRGRRGVVQDGGNVCSLPKALQKRDVRSVGLEDLPCRSDIDEKGGTVFIPGLRFNPMEPPVFLGVIAEAELLTNNSQISQNK